MLFISLENFPKKPNNKEEEKLILKSLYKK